MFETLDLETCSMCNRRCPTCLRNSYPDKSRSYSFFRENYLPLEDIVEIFHQAAEMGFTGDVILSHYNEPLMDDRLPLIAQLARNYSQFNEVKLVTNGDLFTENLADRLDGKLDSITVSLYSGNAVKGEWITNLFTKTKITILTDTTHIPTHFSPVHPVEMLAEIHKHSRCTEVDRRVVINHRGDYLLCCEDLVGHFDLGRFPDVSLKDFWFGEKRTKIQQDLQSEGGRLKYPYCESCPRP